jgi:uridine kinase
LIIWLNGAFGAGKTTAAFELCRRLPDSFVYDPENVGFFPKKPQANFQLIFSYLGKWR